jgi:hypothetical protein
MTPQRPHGRGSFELKKKYRGLPTIRRATGTLDPKVFAQMVTMCDALYTQGRLDVLEAIARGRLRLLDVLNRWRQGREVALPAADVFPRLGDAWDGWAKKVAGKADRRAKQGTRRALKIPADATLAELPRLLAELRPRCARTQRTFNLARAHAQAFLRDAVGRSHGLYAQVQDQRPYQRQARQRGQPHPVALIREVAAKMGPIAGPMAWTLAATGMGNKEYWEDGFEEATDRVLVHGEKRTGRGGEEGRALPRWTVLCQPRLGEKAFRAALDEASTGKVMVYDLRRSFQRWMEEAGVIEINRDAYMGHGPRTMGQLYGWGELPGQLEADAEKLKEYAGEAPRWLQIAAGGKA